MEKLEENISDDDIKKAKELLEKAEKMEKEKQPDSSKSQIAFNETLYRV